MKRWLGSELFRSRAGLQSRLLPLSGLLLGIAFAVFYCLNGLSASDFRRSDTNSDGRTDITDPIATLFYMFASGPVPTCLDAADSNDDGLVNIADPSHSLNYLFLGGPVPPDPGPSICGPDPSNDALTCQTFNICGPDQTELERIGHLLNRAAFGPTIEEVERILAIGTDAWIDEQLDPASIDESGNTALNNRYNQLTETLVRAKDTSIVASGVTWKYFKGSVAPPADWRSIGFDDSGWLSGATGIGYGDNDDATALTDMQGVYNSIYLRRAFTIADVAAINDLVFSVNYDDAFVLYLNGTEVARSRVNGTPNIAGNPPLNTALANPGHEAGSFERFDISSRKNLLQVGPNVLAIQVHNSSRDSGDLSMDPELLDSEPIPGGSSIEIKGVSELKALAHVYSIYSRRQLQAVLADFWENHFTTDFDKVMQTLDDLSNSDASDAMSTAQAAKEAARLEHHEYEFLRENALGYFGDLLLYSATSPTMLIYLDNILNVKGNANENYAREILELHAFGADNEYVQADIEQLAKCFTGWGICKTAPENADNPHAPCGVQVADTAVVAAGPAGGDWRYFKGTQEPGAGWQNLDFIDSTWLVGKSGFGYGDNDDTTTLADMRNLYTSVYVRKKFTIANKDNLDNLVLSVDVDDGFVAYLNGKEVARYYVAGEVGAAVPFDQLAEQSHEAGAPFEYSLNRFRNDLVNGENVLAIQVLNSSKDSSDLTLIPGFLSREILPGSIENGDPGAVFSFHFFPALHNSAEAKTIFASQPTYRLNIPAGRSGTNGILDAQEAVARILAHRSTAEFVSSKLINLLVGDNLDFRTPAQGPYAALLTRCINAWNSTTQNTDNPRGERGSIRTVVREILKSNEFWSATARRSKVKNPLEFIASTARALGVLTSGNAVLDDMSRMGMSLFDRDEPDGYPEFGSEWIDTGTLLARMKLGQASAEGTQASSGDLYWNALAFLDSRGLDTADEIVTFYNRLLFQGTMSQEQVNIVLEFLNTDDNYNPLTFSRARADFAVRTQQALGLMLSFPEWNIQ